MWFTKDSEASVELHFICNNNVSVITWSNNSEFSSVSEGMYIGKCDSTCMSITIISTNNIVKMELQNFSQHQGICIKRIIGEVERFHMSTLQHLFLNNVIKVKKVLSVALTNKKKLLCKI